MDSNSNKTQGVEFSLYPVNTNVYAMWRNVPVVAKVQHIQINITENCTKVAYWLSIPGLRDSHRVSAKQVFGSMEELLENLQNNVVTNQNEEK